MQNVGNCPCRTIHTLVFKVLRGSSHIPSLAACGSGAAVDDDDDDDFGFSKLELVLERWVCVWFKLHFVFISFGQFGFLRIRNENLRQLTCVFRLDRYRGWILHKKELLSPLRLDYRINCSSAAFIIIVIKVATRTATKRHFHLPLCPYFSLACQTAQLSSSLSWLPHMTSVRRFDLFFVSGWVKFPPAPS